MKIGDKVRCTIIYEIVDIKDVGALGDQVLLKDQSGNKTVEPYDVLLMDYEIINQ